VKLERWETVISDKQKLSFQELRDTGNGYVVVQSGDGCRFEIELGDWCGPYVVISEEHLTKYWNNKSKDIGWTFKVSTKDSLLLRCYADAAEGEDYSHYVVSTQDSCIEILALREPVIRSSRK